MQIERKDYDPKQHDVFKALTVKQPYADLLTRVVYQDDSGAFHAAKSIEVRTRNVKFRGDILVCSSANPEISGHLSGVTCGFVELYDVKRVENFTAADWDATCIPEKDRPTTGYGWMMRNPRRVVEMPIKGQLGVYNLIVPKDDITIYPQAMILNDDGWELIKKRMK